jgi:hypothetical protein
MLNQQFTTYDIRAEDITNMFTNLQSLFHDRSALYTPIMVSVSTTLWYIWLYYWKCMINNVPIQSEIIISKIHSQITILLNKRQLD